MPSRASAQSVALAATSTSITRRGAARSRARTASSSALAASPGCLHGVADRRGCAIDGVDRGEPFGAVQSVEPFGHPPCLLASGHQAEADDRFVVTPPDAVDEVEPRRHLVEGALATVDERREHVVDGVEVGLDGGERPGRRRRRRP